MSVLSPSGQVLARWSGDDPAAIGGIFAPHSISVDSEGSIYVAEVTQNVGVNRGWWRRHAHLPEVRAQVGARSAHELLERCVPSFLGAR
ncbi:MAG: hypothetical protein U0893_15945 [Chloroflexota bacterium]